MDDFRYHAKIYLPFAIQAASYTMPVNCRNYLFSTGKNCWASDSWMLMPSSWPLSYYRDKSFYVMRTDALDRFGTRLEKRFSKRQIKAMLESAGLKNIQFSHKLPYWCAVGFKGRIKYVWDTGYITAGSFYSNGELMKSLSSMSDTITHRGPDDVGLWSDAEAGIWLAHRRLSIVDLSPAGHQPMQSESGRYTIAFNGEIYNHQSLRIEMENAGKVPSWHGRSDTETLLHGFDLWGIQKTIEKTSGMFAFAVWDRQRNTLTLGRDRIGEKPLYYGWQGLEMPRYFCSDLNSRHCVHIRLSKII